MGVGDSTAAINILIGSSDKTGPGIDSAEGRLAKLQATIKTSAAVWAGLGAAAGAAVGILSEAARKGVEVEASETRLRQAVANTGKSWEEADQALKLRAEDGRRLAFSQAEMRDSMSSLLLVTGDFNKAMERQRLAMDFARAAHIDLGQAAKLLGKYNDESAKGISRYIPDIQKLVALDKDQQKAKEELGQKVQQLTAERSQATQHLSDLEAIQADKRRKGHALTLQDQFALRDAHKRVEESTKGLTDAKAKLAETTKQASLEDQIAAKIQERAGGQADEYSRTHAAAIDRIKNRFEELYVSAGKALGPHQAMIAMLPGLHAGWLAISPVLGVAARGFVLLTLSMGPVGLALIGITAAVALLTLALSTNFLGIQDKTKAVVGFVRDHLGQVASVLLALTGPIGILAAAWINNWGDIHGKTKAVIEAILGPIRTLIDTVQHALNLLNTVRGHQGHATGNPSSGSYGFRAAASGFSGVVTQPTLFLAGEAGPERVNIRPMRESSGGSSTVNHFHINVQGRDLNPNEIAREVHWAMKGVS